MHGNVYNITMFGFCIHIEIQIQVMLALAGSHTQISSVCGWISLGLVELYVQKNCFEGTSAKAHTFRNYYSKSNVRSMIVNDYGNKLPSKENSNLASQILAVFRYEKYKSRSWLYGMGNYKHNRRIRNKLKNKNLYDEAARWMTADLCERTKTTLHKTRSNWLRCICKEMKNSNEWNHN